MAVPSRTYVGLVVFGLIACLVVLPVTFLTWNGYCPPADAPYKLTEPCEAQASLGVRLFLVLACVFAVAFTVLAWRTLVRAARRDRALREQARRPREEPPGYQ